MHSYTEENYLKAIYRLSNKTDKGVSTNSIAERMETKASSVTDMLKKLSDKKLINYKKYQGVTLTKKGKQVAVSIIRKHRLWEYFLVEHLNFNWDEVHPVAEELEHIKSDLLIERLDEFLNYPKYDPHGDPIPDKEGNFPIPSRIKLTEMAKGKKSVILGVMENAASFLQYLDKLGLNIGTEVKIVEKHDFDNSLDLLINNDQTVHISQEVARNIFVSN